MFLHGFHAMTVAVALAATLATPPIASLVSRLRLGELAGTFLSAVILAAVPNLAAAAGLPIHVGPAVVAGLFIYLPGRQLVASVVDGLNGAPVSSVARGLQALITAGALAVGMLFGGTIGAGLGLTYTPAQGAVPLAVSVGGAAVGVLGLAVAWAMPRRQLGPAVALGAAGSLVASMVTAGSGSPTVP